MAAFYDQGNYAVRIVGQSLTENKKGNPELQLTIKIVGQYAADGELHPIDSEFNRTIFLTLTDGTIGTADRPGWVLEVLQYLGFTGASLAALDPDDKHHVSFVGRECNAYCKVETYEGKEREKWNISRPREAKPAAPIDKKKLRGLDARFGKTLKAFAGRAPATVPPSEPPASPAAAATADDDIPF
jgi:hypothetical protein